MEPFNYLINGPDPVAALQQGMQFTQNQQMGEQNMLAQKQGMELDMAQEGRTQTQFGQQNTLFDQGQQDRIAQQAADQQAQEQAQAEAMRLQEALGNIGNKFEDGTITARDVAVFGTEFPEQSAEIGKLMDGFTTEAKDAEISRGVQAMIAIKTGRTDIAAEIYLRAADGAEAAGNEMQSIQFRAMGKSIEADPSAASAALALLVNQYDPKALVSMLGEGSDADVPAEVRTLQWRAEQAGLVPGTPEYQTFVADNGGGGADVPASFRALELQAADAGLVKGTPKYQEFMLTKGAGSVAQATKEGAALGENITLLASMKSKMPGLEEVVAELDLLADAATYTKAGLANDAVRKQAGMESRPSAVARAEYIATVDNQVLPLLRDTFGAAFTEKEGQTLKATLGDPEMSPAEKKATLRAFIKQKKRDVEELGNQISDAGDGSGSQGSTGQAEIDDLMLGPPK